MEKLIITAAVTGSLPTKKKTPYVPITPAEIIEAGVRCEQAGAAVIHVHARNPEDESPATEFRLFEEIYRGLRERTKLVVQISTGGRAGMAYEQRSERLTLAPEMASLTTGSVNFADSVYANSPQLIERLARDMKIHGIKPEMEIFDVSMIRSAVELAERGLAEPPLHFDFVMGLKGAIPATIENLVHLKNSIPPGATWTVAGVGAAQLVMNTHAILMGGHVRIGLEDNIYYRKGELAPNERFVERMAGLAAEFGREVATPEEARRIMHLKRSG
ncbi:MAG: 3-keto-5-aminohexanoate cleavage protein [Desulfobacterales bacterium]|jgi:3-keto-5-aminohexanoate cleavage enzyme|nr:3-keto-5-aminohexanoate cleavage protein [Desulfobacterales bacterium]